MFLGQYLIGFKAKTRSLGLLRTGFDKITVVYNSFGRVVNPLERCLTKYLFFFSSFLLHENS